MINNSVMKCCICNNEKMGEFITINDNKYHLCCIENLQQENNQLKEQCEKQRYAITENCDLRKQIDKLTQQKQELRNWLEFRWEQSQDVWFVKIINKLNELEGGKNE